MTYTAEVLADAPSGYWKLDETTGTVAADAAGANPGAYVNAPTLADPSLLLDGVGTAVRVAATSSQTITLPGNPIGTNGTLEMWFRWTAGIVLFGTSSTTSNTWQAADGSGGFLVRVGTVNISTSLGTYEVRDGRRHHLVIVKTGTNALVYVDNRLVGFTNSAGPATVMPWTLGKVSTVFGDATFDEVAVYPTSLSAARVAAHYVAGGPSLVAGGLNDFTSFSGWLILDGGSASAVTGNLEKVTLSFYVTHPSAVDLQFFLTGPDGRQALVLDRFGTGADFGTSSLDADRTVLDDAATVAIFDAPSPNVGTFLGSPDLMDFFIGGPSDGVWQLLVVDTSTGSAGTLQAASLFTTVGGVTTRHDFAAGLPLAIPDNDPGGATVSLAVSSVIVEISGGTSLVATASFAPTVAVFTPTTPPPSGSRSANALVDPVTGVSYVWPLNHTEEDPLSFSRQYQSGARSSVGLSRHQDAADPPRWRLQGTILDPTQKSALDALYEACDDRTLEFHDFAGDVYVVTVTSWDVRPERTIRNPITGGYFIWRYTLEMEIVTAFTGPLAVMGLTP